MNYNSAFFSLFENVFLLLKEKYGEGTALELLTNLMEKGLSKSYGTNFEKGSPIAFEQIVGERDRLVGLRVEFDSITENGLIYRFLDDPFPNLKGHVDPQLLDQCYMKFKLNFILGPEWDYKTTKHLWHNSTYTEHVIYKNK
jgi:hypothetical protein